MKRPTTAVLRLIVFSFFSAGVGFQIVENRDLVRTNQRLAAALEQSNDSVERLSGVCARIKNLKPGECGLVCGGTAAVKPETY